jgi:hypothetical protein
MSENSETGDAAKSKFGIGESTKIIGGNGRNELVAQGFVDFLVGSKDGLVVVKETIDLRDLGAGGEGRMDGLRRAIDGSDKGDTAGAKEVGGGS